MTFMSIRIDKQRCTGCGHCRDICPGNLLQADQAGKTENNYPKDCWGCTACLKECQALAIRFYLGSDMGGQGGFLYVRQANQYLHWIIAHPDGRETVITTNSGQANTY
jgi:adenylylsulfate reductase subunit B